MPIDPAKKIPCKAGVVETFPLVEGVYSSIPMHDVAQAAPKFLSNQYPKVWTRSKLTEYYKCMDRHGKLDTENLKWAEDLWKQNLTYHAPATQVMFLAACLR